MDEAVIKGLMEGEYQVEYEAICRMIKRANERLERDYVDCSIQSRQLVAMVIELYLELK